MNHFSKDCKAKKVNTERAADKAFYLAKLKEIDEGENAFIAKSKVEYQIWSSGDEDSDEDKGKCFYASHSISVNQISNWIDRHRENMCVKKRMNHFVEECINEENSSQCSATADTETAKDEIKGTAESNLDMICEKEITESMYEELACLIVEGIKT